MKITFEFHFDGGHGWLKVPRQFVNDMGLKDKISKYSYQFMDMVYLEEDCDAPMFFEAWKAAGNDQVYQEINDGADSRIRSFETYKSSEVRS